MFNIYEIIEDMLFENTGIHMCDSGMENGRHWQQNRENGILTGPIPIDYYLTSKQIQLNPIVPVSDFLIKNLIYTYTCDEFQEQLENEVEDLWCCWDYEEWVRNNFNTDWGLINTYNGECVLSQTLQFLPFKYDYDDYLILQIHNGADVRGGYTKPKIFKIDDLGMFINGINCANVYCECGEIDLTVDVSNYEYLSYNGCILDDYDIYNLTEIKIEINSSELETIESMFS